VSSFDQEIVSPTFIVRELGIKQTLEFELEGHIPFELEKLVIDYHVSQSTKEESKVLSFYTLKEDFTGWLGLLQNCRIDPQVVTSEGIDYLNLVCLSMIPPEGPYAVIDIGHSKTNITLCCGKRLSFVRSIATGGKHLTEAIAKKTGVPLDEAEKMKIEMGGITSDEETEMDDLSKQVAEAMKETLDELVLNIKQALFSYQDSEGGPVEGIYLCGGTSRLPGLDRYLSLRLKQNVTHIDCTTFHYTKPRIFFPKVPIKRPSP